MFTGIVEELATVTELDLQPGGGRMSILGPKVGPTLEVDASVAVNGVCLTVVAVAGAQFTVDVVPETLAKTNLGELAIGARVGLERPVTLSTPLGGHLVQGHVDGVARIVSKSQLGLQESICLDGPPNLLRYIVPKGFVALDGVSLTVVECDSSQFQIALIPHSAEMTTLGFKQVGDRVNVEVDLVAKYVERFVTHA